MLFFLKNLNRSLCGKEDGFAVSRIFHIQEYLACTLRIFFAKDRLEYGSV
jgi:hypothetical protein